MKDFYKTLPEGDRNFIDWTMLVTTVASFFSYLPDMAALASFVWVLLRIWETDTIKNITGRKEEKVE